ncbi:hypothetical protein GIB67_019553 [Kingdonia uniflora]|uniref:RNase H type-1 domain-containing protein n=1 Tax=Kingdonia uniflora TaxID=39325 RepID=A0A7J7N0F3_9MAGN|nr:hypothetical protein GIB67_019553 [Kingdonia uniflora]
MDRYGVIVTEQPNLLQENTWSLPTTRRHILVQQEVNSSGYSKTSYGPYYLDSSKPHVSYYKWPKPQAPFVVLNTDGSVREDGCGVGGILRDHNGDSLVAFAAKCEKMPVYVVELQAVRTGLYVALSRGVRYILINIDCTDAIACICSPLTFCNPIVREIVEDIRRLLRMFTLWDCSHLVRETNRGADFLSKFVKEGPMKILQPWDFPSKLAQIVKEDKFDCMYVRVKSQG